MSAERTGSTASTQPESTAAAEATPNRRRDVLWTVVAFLVLGVAAGLVWQWVATPPYVVRTAQGAVMDQAQLGVKVNADGWFVTIGAVAGLVAGFSLVHPRRRDVLLVVLLGTVLSLGAGYLALSIGTALGDTSTAAIRAASVGDKVPAPLQVISRFVLLAWPLGFLVAAVAVLVGGNRETVERDDPAAADVAPAARG